jgi:hypothetical protein
VQVFKVCSHLADSSGIDAVLLGNQFPSFETILLFGNIMNHLSSDVVPPILAQNIWAGFHASHTLIGQVLG